MFTKFSVFQILLATVCIMLGASISGVSSQPNFSGTKLPMVMQYKMKIKPGEAEWYYQDTEPGAYFSIDLQVISSGFGYVGFAINDPNSKGVVQYNWNSNASYETKSAIGGYYGFFIDNKFSLFSDAVVSVYLHSYHKDGEWADVSGVRVVEGVEDSTKNISKALAGIRAKVSMMKTYLFLSRRLESMDMALLESNNNLVTYWSAAPCVVIILSALLHVYFIRRFFDIPSGNKTRGFFQKYFGSPKF